MRGILIKKEFAKKIIKRAKKTEYRDYKLPSNYLHQPIYLLSEGYVLGIIHLSLKLIKVDGYIYKIVVHEEFNPPKKYKHPMGAQLYVKEVKIK